MKITGRKLTELECAIEDAAKFHAGMTAELERLSAEAEESGFYDTYDETAADLREQAEYHLADIITAYEKEQA